MYFIDITGIFAVAFHFYLRSFFSGRPQYTGYPHKLTTCTLSHPVKYSLKFDFLLSRGSTYTFPSKLSPQNLSVLALGPAPPTQATPGTYLNITYKH